MAKASVNVTLSVLSHELDGDVWRMVLGTRVSGKGGAVDLGAPADAMEIVFAADDERWADATPAEAKKLQLAEVKAAWQARASEQGEQ